MSATQTTWDATPAATVMVLNCGAGARRREPADRWCRSAAWSASRCRPIRRWRPCRSACSTSPRARHAAGRSGDAPLRPPHRLSLRRDVGIAAGLVARSASPPPPSSCSARHLHRTASMRPTSRATVSPPRRRLRRAARQGDLLGHGGRPGRRGDRPAARDLDAHGDPRHAVRRQLPQPGGVALLAMPVLLLLRAPRAGTAGPASSGGGQTTGRDPADAALHAVGGGRRRVLRPDDLRDDSRADGHGRPRPLRRSRRARHQWHVLACSRRASSPAILITWFGKERVTAAGLLPHRRLGRGRVCRDSASSTSGCR